MKCPQLLFTCWCSSILAVSSCITVDGYSCVSDDWQTVSCVLNTTDNPMEQTNTTYSLKFADLIGGDPAVTCPLTVKNHSHSCVCKVVTKPQLVASRSYSIEVCNGSGCQSVTETFETSQNIKLKAPQKVEVHQTPEAFNVTWKSGYEAHPYLSTVLDYELLLQRRHSSRSRNLSSREKFELIPRLQLEAPATYCTKVRSKPFEMKMKTFGAFRGTWSEWSREICWENGMQEEQEHILVTLTKSLGPVCVVIGLLLLVFYSSTVRMKIKTLSHIPSPSPFFQALYQQHDGNLQKWLCPQGKFALSYSTDEILITESVTVLPKPMTKDPEENQNLHNPTVMPLIFSQCQTSYVGVPGIQEASQPVTMLCQGDTPYTQLPCSVWGFGTEDIQVVSSPPEDTSVCDHIFGHCELGPPGPEHQFSSI